MVNFNKTGHLLSKVIPVINLINLPCTVKSVFCPVTFPVSVIAATVVLLLFLLEEILAVSEVET